MQLPKRMRYEAFKVHGKLEILDTDCASIGIDRYLPMAFVGISFGAFADGSVTKQEILRGLTGILSIRRAL